jgi:photosystem II stability/assembly factor-like uncharacterized protein
MKILVFLLFTSLNLFVFGQHLKSIGPPGGDVSGVAIHPTDLSIIYANTRFGVLFKTVDGGLTSENINPEIDHSYGSRIAIHPTNPNIIFAVGRKSTDGGITWGDQILSSHPVFNPLNPDVIYTSVNNVLKISRDIGESWDTLFSFNFDRIKYSISGDDTSIMYLKSGYDIYKSTNSGIHWINISDSTFKESNPLCLAIMKNEPNSVLVGTEVGIYKTTDAGNHWKKTSDYLVINEMISVTPELIYAVSGDYLWGITGHFLKSTDGGESWSEQNNGLPKSQNRFLYSVASASTNPNFIVIGSYGFGVYKSFNGGESWIWTNTTSELDLDLYFDPVYTNHLYVGTNSKGIIKSVNEGIDWDLLEFGSLKTSRMPFRQLRFSNSNTNTAFVTANGHGLLKSTDHGVSWSLINVPFLLDSYTWSIGCNPADEQHILIGLSGYGYRDLLLTENGGTIINKLNLTNGYGGIYDIHYDYNNSEKVYVATTDYGLFRSNNSGKDWQQINSGIESIESTYLPFTSITSVPGLDGALFSTQESVGNYYGALYRSTNGGTYWCRIDSTLKILDKNLNLSKVFVHPLHQGFIYVSANQHGQYSTYSSGGFFRSSDNGWTWQKLYDWGVSTFVIHPIIPSKFYLSTKSGIIVIHDSILVSVEKIINHHINDFRLSQNYPNPFNPSTTISYSVPHNTGKGNAISLRIYDVLGRIVSTLVNDVRSAGNYSVNFDASQYSSGIYYYQLRSGNFVETKKMVLMK